MGPSMRSTTRRCSRSAKCRSPRPWRCWASAGRCLGWSGVVDRTVDTLAVARGIWQRRVSNGACSVTLPRVPMAEADYPVVIASLPAEDGGGYLGTVPDLPGCMSDGATREEAAHNVADAIAAWIEEATATGRPV